MYSMINRRGTFLAQEKWTTTPFNGQSISILQLLLNRVCGLPGLLERYYAIGDLSDASKSDTVQRLWNDFHSILAGLREWEQNASSQASHPLVWSRTDRGNSLLSSVHVLWFPNMMIANSLTHYWAFEIIVRIHLSNLHQILSAAENDGRQTHVHTCTEASKEKSLLTLADMICDSISYLLQPEMKLHGLGSAFFTIPSALRVFRREKNLSSGRLARCEQISDLLASRGIEFLCQ